MVLKKNSFYHCAALNDSKDIGKKKPKSFFQRHNLARYASQTKVCNHLIHMVVLASKKLPKKERKTDSLSSH